VRRIAWLDVFTDRPFAGNQLAVVTPGDGLSAEEMQSIARELTISETVFVLEDARRLRIFTPGYELPLAGHPTVGAALECARTGLIPSDGRWVFQTGVGDTPVDVRDGVATMTQAAPELGDLVDAALVAAALGVGVDDIASPPQFCTTTKLAQLFVELRSRSLLAGLAPDERLVSELPGEGVAPWYEVGPGEVAQRMFAPEMGVMEDPATGSAAGALGALRVFRGAAPGPLLVRQGEELGRPSSMHVTVGGAAGAPADVRVGGTAVLVMEGELRL
jgi:trans-2,3-dihydro-3-hydroxyanthranilate isomerase